MVINVEDTEPELMSAYPGCRVKVAEDQREMVAEITGEFAIAVIDRSQPHFHAKMTEEYRVLRGTLNVVVGGIG